MVPKPGEPGLRDLARPTARPGRAAAANCWVTRTYDPELNLLYFGTGNPCPDFDGAVREGDNLYTDSGVAVDADTGEIKSHFQYTPARPVGLRLHDGAHPVRPRRAEAGRPLRQERVPLHPRPHEHGSGPRGAVRRPHRLGRGRREGQRDAEGLPRQGGRPGPLLARAGRRQGVDARVLQPEDRAALRAGAGRRRDGHAAAQGVQGEHPVLGRRRRRRPRRHGGLHQRLRPAHGPGAVALDATTSRCARRCWPRAAASCSPASRPASSTRSTPAAGSCCGSSSAAAATTAARRTYSIDGRQYIAVPTGWGAWTEGFLPGMLGAGQGSALFAFALPE